MDTPLLPLLLDLLSWPMIAATLAVLLLAWLLSYLLGTLGRLLLQHYPHYRLRIPGILLVLRLLLGITVLTYLTFGLWGLPNEMLLALLASSGIALGLSAQDALKSFVAGILMLFERPYVQGDMVAIGSHYGEVIHIGLLSTRLRTFNDDTIIVPNSEVMRQSLVNANGGELSELVAIDWWVPAQLSLQECMEALPALVRHSPYCLLSRPVVCAFSSQHDHQPNRLLTLKAYVVDVRFERRFASDVQLRLDQWLANKNPAS